MLKNSLKKNNIFSNNINTSNNINKKIDIIKIKNLLKNVKNKYWYLIGSLYNKHDLITFNFMNMILNLYNVYNFILRDYKKISQEYTNVTRLNNILLPIPLYNHKKNYYLFIYLFNKLPFLKKSVDSVLTLYGVNKKNVENNIIIQPNYFEKVCLEYEVSKKFYNVYWYAHNIDKNLDKYNDLQNTNANLLNEPDINTKVDLCFYNTKALYHNFDLNEQSRCLNNINSIF